MTTKIEITVTENDDVIFVYMYKERTLIDKFQIPKHAFPGRRKNLIHNICDTLGHSLKRIMESIIEGD